MYTKEFITMVPQKVNLKIYQGSTFTETFRWESSTKIYTPITAAFKAAPLVITATAHGMLAGWRGKISNIIGMTEANALDYIIASSVTSNNVTFNSVNAAGFKDYISGGILEYNEPVSLAGATARMQIRSKITDSIFLEELTTENGKLSINDSGKTITLSLSAANTTAYTFKAGVYSLEIIIAGVVTPLVNGSVSVVNEVTR
jgi:hypothetical protein